MDIDDATLVKLVFRLKQLEDEKKYRKKQKSTCNKRYYQKHRAEIISRNMEMRNLYKLVKQNNS